MKKTLTINLNGTVFHIDEDAYSVLKNYLSDVEKHLPTADRQEIMNDIEARIAELFSDNLKGKDVVTIDDVNGVIAILGNPSQYSDADENADEKSENEKSDGKKKTSRRFYRDPEKAVLGGVCAGLDAYTGIDKVLWRIILIILIFVGYGLVIPIYILVWLIAPKAVTMAQRLEMSGKDVTVETIKEGIASAKTYVESEEFKSSAKSVGQRLGEVFMFFVKLFGAFFGIILGIVGFAVFAALIAVLVTVIANPSLSGDWFNGITTENAVLMLISILLVVGCPVFSIIYGVIRLLAKGRARSNSPQWISLVLWLAGIFMLISVGVKTGLNYKSFDDVNVVWWDDDSKFGADTTIVRGVPHFTKIDARGAVKVEFVQDSFQTVTVTAPQGIMDRIYTKVENGELKIYTRKLSNYGGRVRIRLTTDSIYRYQGSGATRFTASQPVSTSHFALDLSGASRADIDSLLAPKFSAEISGASHAELAGAGVSLDVDVSGASKLDAKKFAVKTAKIKASGASSASVNVSEKLNADASGASTIRYAGNPQEKAVQSSGGAKVKNGE